MTTDEVFDLDAAAEDIEYPPFVFKKGRKKYQMPNLFTLTPDELQELDAAEGLEPIQDLFRKIGADAVADLMGTIPSVISFRLMRQWREFSMATMREVEGLDGDGADGGGEGGAGKAPRASSQSSATSKRAKPSRRT